MDSVVLGLDAAGVGPSVGLGEPHAASPTNTRPMVEQIEVRTRGDIVLGDRRDIRQA